MRLLRVFAENFKNAANGVIIDLVPQARKSDEDKFYEMNEIAHGLFVYSTGAFIGKNASGKTTALDLLDCAYSILGEYRLEGKHYSCDGTRLEIIFYHAGYIYRYRTLLYSQSNSLNRTLFSQQEIARKKYSASNAGKIYQPNGFEEIDVPGKLPKDTSIVFFISGEQELLSEYFSSSDDGADVYSHAFNILEGEKLGIAILSKILYIFDENITKLTRLDDHNFKIIYNGTSSIKSDKELLICSCARLLICNQTLICLCLLGVVSISPSSPNFLSINSAVISFYLSDGLRSHKSAKQQPKLIQWPRTHTKYNEHVAWQLYKLRAN